jgi:hypothetical protein
LNKTGFYTFATIVAILEDYTMKDEPLIPLTEDHVKLLEARGIKNIVLAKTGLKIFEVKGQSKTLLIRLLEKIVVKENGCWEWQGTKNTDGYGKIYFGPKKRMALAHRVTYLIFRGIIPRRRVTDHLCLNKKCCNPWHLEIVTYAVNIERGPARKLLKLYQNSITHCPKGHSYDQKNTIFHSKTGGRMCRECIKISTNTYLMRKKYA